ncbi:helix-turn-helix domain-containing protein [uncultured Ruminococcus sp.]|uniref:helix-turn-helix domain-containing protein n=1 Tax=uncultured Ruminococcus sp. TaxID=165186 RepID=UPI0025CF9889|nr:helix-turn-helix transcriptional regulator [uncultured Ruminococcus sp.]
MYFYQRIRDLREDNDLSQQKVADYLEITRQQYQLYESGKREMPMHLFIKLADFYKVSLDYLAGRRLHRKEMGS